MKTSLLILAAIFLSLPAFASREDSDSRILQAEKALAVMPLDSDVFQAHSAIVNLTESDIGRLNRSLPREQKLALKQQIRMLLDSETPPTLADVTMAAQAGVQVASPESAIVIGYSVARIIALYEYMTGFSTCEWIAHRNHRDMDPTVLCKEVEKNRL